MQVVSFKISEFAEIIERDIADGSDLLPDCFLEVENFPVGARVDGGKIRGDIFGILLKFPFPVWKDEFGCSESDPPGNNPVSVSVNRFCWFGGSKMQLKFAEVFNCLAVSGSGEHSGENNVKVDGLSQEDIVPFHDGKFGNLFSSEDFEFGEFEVEGIILDHLPCKFLAHGEESFVG